MTPKEIAFQGKIDELRELLPPGSEVKTVLRHCSKSGMMRVVLPLYKGERIPYIDEVTQFKYNKNHDGFTVHGCGTDVGFELVYNLSSAIYRNGFDCIGNGPFGNRCPSNDHVNIRDQSQMPKHHKDGGYALRQRWV
jgi:hypothetical protein